jgi:hypothetical protein
MGDGENTKVSSVQGKVDETTEQIEEAIDSVMEKVSEKLDRS